MTHCPGDEYKGTAASARKGSGFARHLNHSARQALSRRPWQAAVRAAEMAAPRANIGLALIPYKVSAIDE